MYLCALHDAKMLSSGTTAQLVQRVPEKNKQWFTDPRPHQALFSIDSKKQPLEISFMAYHITTMNVCKLDSVLTFVTAAKLGTEMTKVKP